jgi:predicted GTPase
VGQPSLWSRLRRTDSRHGTSSLRLVIGLNRVDEIVPDGWNTQVNLPSPEAIAQIKRKCDNVIRLLAMTTQIDSSHIEYYSAIKRYRLHHLLNRVINNCYAGFKFTDVEPLNFEDVDGVDPEARQFAKEERQRQLKTTTTGTTANARERLFSELGRFIGSDDLKRIRDRFDTEMQQPPRIAVLGQSGVGKTTTVNALFATNWRTSAVEVGTHTAQNKTVELPSGGRINIVDLPGYGRSIDEDARYQQIYKDFIPSCDLILLIVQADRGDLADDQEMIIRIRDWIRDAPDRR